MTWLVIIPVLVIIFYGLGIYFWNRKVRWRLNVRSSKRLKYTHYAFAILTVAASLLILFDDISFAGQWTTRIILIGFLLSGIIIHPLSEWSGKPGIEKNYFRVFAFLPILTAGISLIPFLGAVVVLSLFGRLIAPAEDIYYEDKTLRVQSTFIGVLGPPRLDIVEKKGLFEVRVNKAYRSAADIDSVRIVKNGDETSVIVYNQPYDWTNGVDADTIKFK
jgi:hypothetical protein